jgi:hypothetical protein
MAVPPSKPFFFRLEPSKLLSALIQVPEQERGDWITRAAIELATGNPTLEFTKSLFEEAEEFKRQSSERSRLAGLASAESKKQRTSTDVQRTSTDVQRTSTDVQQKSTDPNPVAVTETIKEKNKEKKIAFRENVTLYQAEYDKLLKKHGKDHLNLMLDKLDSYKLSHGKKYVSDYGAINQWVAESVQKPMGSREAFKFSLKGEPYC